jgi:hypothetical protein
MTILAGQGEVHGFPANKAVSWSLCAGLYWFTHEVNTQ